MKRAPEANQFSAIFQHPYTVAVTDLNYGNHVGNDRILGLLHDARVAWLAQHQYSESDVGGCGMIMAGAALDYRNQALLHQQLCIEVGVSSVGKTRFSLVYCISDQDHSRQNKAIVVAYGVTDMSCFDYSKQKPVPIPEGFRALLTNQPC